MITFGDSIHKNLIDYQLVLLKKVNNRFYRSIFSKIDWNIRMIALKGPRGAGKTTLMLQKIKYHTDKELIPLYISMEHPFFYDRGSLFNLVQEYYQYGGRYLFIDEVHKYENWSRELKVIYDGFPDLKVVFSASSALEIYKGEADLSRRVITYDFPGMSFKEYLELAHKLKFRTISFDDILTHHREFSMEVSLKVQILPLFFRYLREGYLPIIKEVTAETYSLQVIQIINTSLFQDLQLAARLNAGTVNKLKRLLGVIANSVPFEPNISAIAEKTGIARETVYEFLTYLEQAKILNMIRKKPKGITALQKPDKIYFENPNLIFALQNNPEIGTVRETFFLNQLLNTGHKITLPDSKYDFLVLNKYIMEIGGKNKTVKDKKVFIAVDGIEVGFGQTVPLWLFGFLY